MGEKTGIAWTHSTWNPWRGCAKVSPGCKFCYMFREQERYGRDPAVVQRCADTVFNKPYKWQQKDAKHNGGRFVFTCSWSDWFHPSANAWRAEAWKIVRECPNLAFQILTKRPENITAMLPADWGAGYPNVWLGVSIENNDYVWRAEALKKIQAQIRFISAEPLLGPLDRLDMAGIDWIILGGESGNKHKVRVCDGTWMLDIMKRRPAGTAVFVKQLGRRFVWHGTELKITNKGADIVQFPEELRVQEFPACNYRGGTADLDNSRVTA